MKEKNNNLTMRYNVTGRRVDFINKDNLPYGVEKELSWGIEINFPIDDKDREAIGKLGVIFPERINTIRFLDLAPQESLQRIGRLRSKYVS